MNHRYLSTALKLTLAVVVTAAIGASQAHADSKIYSGLTCVNYGSLGIANYEYGAIGNYSRTDTLRVGCPIVRDGAIMTSGYVQVFNQPGAPGVECRIAAASIDEDKDRLSYTVSPYQRSTKDGGDQLFFFGDPGGTALSHYYYFCNIPPMTAEGASFVVSYQVTEIDEIE
jgi:hypothetical protein